MAVRVEEKDFHLISKLDDLTLYQFHTMTARDYFCPVCGILPFRRPRTAPELWTVNVRCLEGVDLEQLETIKVYGRIHPLDADMADDRDAGVDKI